MSPNQVFQNLPLDLLPPHPFFHVFHPFCTQLTTRLHATGSNRINWQPHVARVLRWWEPVVEGDGLLPGVDGTQGVS